VVGACRSAYAALLGGCRAVGDAGCFRWALTRPLTSITCGARRFAAGGNRPLGFDRDTSLSGRLWPALSTAAVGLIFVVLLSVSAYRLAGRQQEWHIAGEIGQAILTQIVTAYRIRSRVSLLCLGICPITTWDVTSFVMYRRCSGRHLGRTGLPVPKDQQPDCPDLAVTPPWISLGVRTSWCMTNVTRTMKYARSY